MAPASYVILRPRQVRPPSVLRRIVSPPTATQVLGRGQDTPNRTVLGVPLGWLRQVRPPSVLRRIVPRGRIPLSPPPLPPTATQVLGLGQATPYAR
jgi:hypothetical protein